MSASFSFIHRLPHSLTQQAPFCSLAIKRSQKIPTLRSSLLSWKNKNVCRKPKNHNPCYERSTESNEHFGLLWRAYELLFQVWIVFEWCLFNGMTKVEGLRQEGTPIFCFSCYGRKGEEKKGVKSTHPYDNPRALLQRCQDGPPERHIVGSMCPPCKDSKPIRSPILVCFPSIKGNLLQRCFTTYRKKDTVCQWIHQDKNAFWKEMHLLSPEPVLLQEWT